MTPQTYRAGDRDDAPVVVKLDLPTWQGYVRCQVIEGGVLHSALWCPGTTVHVKPGELREAVEFSADTVRELG